MLEVEAYVMPKKTVSDPQGLAVKHALDALGYKEIEEVRVGKVVTIKLNLKSKKDAEVRVNEMCKKLLANLIIEDYHFRINEDTT
jgi:phosphoribosylformylglycinamidine synthase